MAEIEVHSDAYDVVRTALTEAAEKLATAGSDLGSAVPAMALGSLGAFVPPVFNGLGAVVNRAAQGTGGIARRTSEGVQRALDGFDDVEESARGDFERYEGDL